VVDAAAVPWRVVRGKASKRGRRSRRNARSSASVRDASTFAATRAAYQKKDKIINFRLN
jgi:hypothetical protein